MKKSLNQKLIDLVEYYNLTNINILLSENAIKRSHDSNNPRSGSTKLQKLQKLKNNIKNIKNCELKKSATNMVFADGNINSKIMIIGEGPGAQEDKERVSGAGGGDRGHGHGR